MHNQSEFWGAAIIIYQVHNEVQSAFRCTFNLNIDARASPPPFQALKWNEQCTRICTIRIKYRLYGNKLKPQHPECLSLIMSISGFYKLKRKRARFPADNIAGNSNCTMNKMPYPNCTVYLRVRCFSWREIFLQTISTTETKSTPFDLISIEFVAWLREIYGIKWLWPSCQPRCIDRLAQFKWQLLIVIYATRSQNARLFRGAFFEKRNKKTDARDRVQGLLCFLSWLMLLHRCDHTKPSADPAHSTRIHQVFKAKKKERRHLCWIVYAQFRELHVLYLHSNCLKYVRGTEQIHQITYDLWLIRRFCYRIGPFRKSYLLKFSSEFKWYLAKSMVFRWCSFNHSCTVHAIQ